MSFLKPPIFSHVQHTKKNNKYTMNFKNKINSIKVILGLEVALASAKLVDGTVVEAESFEIGFPLFVTAEDGTKSPAPAGEHTLEDGTVVTVDEQGTIVEIAAASEEAPEAPEAEVAVEAAEMPVEEPKKEEAPVAEAVTEALKKLAMVVEEVVKEVSDIKTEMKSMKEKYEKFSATPGASKFPSVTKEAFEANDPVEAKIALLNELKKENFFKAR